MKQEITIVTAFFRINRAEMKGFERTDEQYFEYFKGWAKLKNMIVVYVETDELKNRILEFRDSLGLKDKTIVNVVDNCFELDSELYNAMEIATNNPIQQLYRIRPNNPDASNAKYNYVQLLKTLCVKDAVDREQAKGMVAWMDFGYNHGWSTFTPDSDFNYTWEFDFPDKINVSAIQKPDDRPIYDIIFSMDTYIMGGGIIAPDGLWGELWNLLRESMIALCSCGLCDDDQNLLLMAYRKKPEIFKLWYMGWSMQLYEFGGKEHLILREHRDSALKNIAKDIWHGFQLRKECARYVISIFSHLLKYPPK